MLLNRMGFLNALPEVNSELTSEFNVHYDYNAYILRIVIAYGDAFIQKDYDQMYHLLVLLENTIAPQIEKDESESNLLKIEELVSTMIKKDKLGRIISYYPEKIREANKLMNETYSLILIKLHKKGILTKPPNDPKHAMAKFGGS